MNYEFYQNKFGQRLYVLAGNGFLIEVNYEQQEFGDIEFVGMLDRNIIINWRISAKQLTVEKGMKIYKELKNRQPLLPELFQTISIKAKDLMAGQWLHADLTGAFHLIRSVKLLKKGDPHFSPVSESIHIKFFGAHDLVGSQIRDMFIKKGVLPV